MAIQDSPANFALDGVIGCRLSGGEHIGVSQAASQLKLLKPRNFNYFETLYSKLGWQG